MTAPDYLAKLERDMAIGVLHLLLLAHIRRGAPIHGYGLIRAIAETTRGGLQLKAGTVYPILNDLEESGIVRSEWGQGESGPQRRYYELTPRGRQVLDLVGARWAGLRDAVDGVLGTGGG